MDQTAYLSNRGEYTTFSVGDRPDEIVYEKEDFQTFRNNLHHRIKTNELECILDYTK